MTLTVPPLIEFATELERLAEPRPRLALGGQAFYQNEELRAQFPAVVWATTARELTAVLAQS